MLFRSYEDFTPEQIDDLKGPLTLADLTPERLETIKGPQGDRGPGIHSVSVDGSDLVFTVDEDGIVEISRIPLVEAANGIRDEISDDLSASKNAATVAEEHADRSALSAHDSSVYKDISLSAAERAEFAAEETIQQVEGDFATRNYVDNKASELTNELDGNSILGTVRTAVPAPVSATVTADIPAATFTFEPARWPTLDGDGLVPESLLPEPNITSILGPDGLIPVELLPKIATEPIDLTRVWAITDAVNPPPPIPSPDSLSAPAGVRMSIPTHDGSGQAVHPSVHHFPAGVFGYEWWMAVTGYAGRSTVHEDPLLLASHTGLPGSWVAPDGVPFPIDDAGNAGQTIGYNSDPDLVWDAVEGRMYVFWRRFKSSGDPVYTTLYVRSSTDGVTWTDAEVVMYVDHWQPATAPYFHVDNLGQWTMHSVTTTNPGVLQIQYADDVLGPWSDPTDTDLVMPGGLRLWHCEVRKVGSWWLALAQDRTTAGNGGGELRVAVSRDGVTGWKVAQNSIVSRSSSLHDWLYASSLVPYSSRGEWRWRLYYSAFNGSQSWLYYTEV